jgi:enoyl-CoA hydratase/carnithine racemase
MSDRVITNIVDHVATVTLNRADKRNAVDMAMFEGLIESAEALAENQTVRAVVLHGDGEHFCAGIDISVFQGAGIGEESGDLLKPRSGSTANFFQSAALVWRELPVPVLAAVQGTAFGAGLQIAMGADMRYASPDVKISVMEIKWGIIPDMGITSTLPGVVSEDKARELAYTGHILSAVEAHAAGLVTEVVDDPLLKAHEIAAEIAGKSPDAIRAIKQLFNESWKDDPASGLRREADLQAAIMAGKNQSEAVNANMEKRAPRFRDPGT